MTIFHLNRLEFLPRKGFEGSHNSSDIMKEVYDYLKENLTKGKGIIIDRHENIDGSKRELFVSGLRILPGEKRMLFTLALLRSGRKPKVKDGETSELKDLEGDIAEETHFFIDYNRIHPIICVEYNYHGARGSDIEYYLRQIAHEKIKKAKGTSLTLIMNTNIDEVIKNFENTLKFEFKINPTKIEELNKQTKGNYFSMMTGLGQKLKPQALRINAMFQSQGRKLTIKNKKNDEANAMIKDLLPRFKSKFFIENFQDFVLTYESIDGEELTENLMKSVLSFEKELKDEHFKLRTMYDFVEEDFNTSIQNV